MANPSLQIGNSNWAIKEDNLLGYSTAGTRFVPQPITMTRASAGTRVNSSGLVETVELLGSEEVTGFTNGTSYPFSTFTTSGSNITSAIISSSFAGAVSNSISIVNGKTYKVTFTYTKNSGDDLRVLISSSVSGAGTSISNIEQVSASGDITLFFTATSTTTGYLQMGTGSGSDSLDISITNISVKESTKNNLARVDYDGTASSLLVEPERTNELTQSNQFDTTWNQSGTLTSGQDGVGGSTNAWKFQNPGTTSGLNQPDTTSGVQTVSAYFKKNSDYGVRFYMFGSVNCATYFDLNNGTVVSSINSTAKVESAGADWFRCSMTFDQTNTAFYFYVTDNNANQVVGNITLQYAQLEVGSYPTSYIPTDGGTVTRNQDQYSKTGISNLINSEEGVLFVEMAALSDDLSYRILSLSNGTSNERVYIQYTNVSNTIAVVVKEDGNTQANMSYVLSDETAFAKVAIKWKAGTDETALWVNGFERDTDTLGNTPVGLNRLALDNGNSITGGNKIFGKVKQLQVFKTALTDPELVTLTT